MAKVDCKIDLVVLWNVENVLLVLHVHRDELVANLWRMLSVVHKAELLGLDIDLQDWVAFKSDTLTLNFLSPSVLVETFSEKDHICQYSFVISLVDSIAHSVKV